MKLSVAVCREGAWKPHATPASVEEAKSVVQALAAAEPELEWQVIDLDLESVDDVVGWWEDNPWTRSPRKPERRRFHEKTVVHGSAEEVAKKAVPVIADALRALMARDERLAPFVIVRDHYDHLFVQWCGGAPGGSRPGRPLRFEVPALGFAKEPVEGVLEDHAREAVEMLHHLGASLELGLTVIESDTFFTVEHGETVRAEIERSEP